MTASGSVCLIGNGAFSGNVSKRRPGKRCGLAGKSRKINIEPFASLKKIAMLLVVGYGCYGAFHAGAFWFLDGANLLFHEGGHVVFGFLGPWAAVAGGTAMQLIIPAGVAVSFSRSRQPFSSALGWFWFGENFLHIAPYVADARSRQLPLVGGGEHDWHYLLSSAGLLPYDGVIADVLWFVALAIMTASAVPVLFRTNRNVSV